MNLRKESGFTLVEVIVVAAIIAVLAGILVPMIFGQIDQAKLSKAQADTKTISTSIYVFRKDTGQWPDKSAEGCTPTTYTFGSGTLLTASLTAKGYDTSNGEYLTSSLTSDPSGCYGSNFNGPYIASVDADPWGNAYIVNTANFSGNNPTMIFSAGPDGVVDTGPNDAAANGDDIVYRVK